MEYTKMNEHQRGMTFVGLMMLLVIVVIASTILMKIVPLYLENFKVTTSLDSLAKDSNLSTMSYDGIRDLLLKRLDINDVDRFTKKDIEITEQGKKLKVSINYEARTPIIMNLDIVAKFNDNKVEIVKP